MTSFFLPIKLFVATRVTRVMMAALKSMAAEQSGTRAEAAFLLSVTNMLHTLAVSSFTLETSPIRVFELETRPTLILCWLLPVATALQHFLVVSDLVQHLLIPLIKILRYLILHLRMVLESNFRKVEHMSFKLGVNL